MNVYNKFLYDLDMEIHEHLYIVGAVESSKCLYSYKELEVWRAVNAYNYKELELWRAVSISSYKESEL